MRRFNDIIILFSIMLAAAGCCRHDKITVEDNVRITLSPVVSAGTKAVVNEKSDLLAQSYGENGIGFGVFGYKSLKEGDNTSPKTLVFNNTEVKPSADTETEENKATWSYTPIRYWDSNSNAYYQFVAYWPHLQSAADQNNASAPWVENANVIGQNTTAGMLLTLHNIPNWQDSISHDTRDYLVAQSKGKYKGSGEGVTYYSNGIVPFTFSHILSKLTIKAYYVGVKENHISVHNITLGREGNNLLSTNGVVNYTKPYGGNNAAAAFTDPTKGGTSQVLFNANATTPATPHTLQETAFYDQDTPANTPNCLHEAICTWLVVPTGGWNGLKLNVSFAIGDDAEPTPIEVSGINIGTADAYAMASGYQYILTLKFDSSGGGIDVEMVYVKDWVDSNVDHEVYNW